MKNKNVIIITVCIATALVCIALTFGVIGKTKVY